MNQPSINPKLAAMVLTVWDEGLAMRAAGATPEARNEHIYDRLLTFAHRIGMVVDERNLPSWHFDKCSICRDDGWQATTQIVRGVEVECYVRCTCKPPLGMTSSRETDQAAAVAKVASGWTRGGRR